MSFSEEEISKNRTARSEDMLIFFTLIDTAKMLSKKVVDISKLYGGVLNNIRHYLLYFFANLIVILF